MPYPAKLSAAQIMDAAQHLLETQGAEALTMRNLAQALGVRPSSLYRHFESRELLLRAIGDRAALALQSALEHVARHPDPATGLRQAADAYLHYARTHPHLYALLLNKGDDLTPEQLAHSAGKQLWNTFLSIIGKVSGHPDDTDHAVAFWTFLHGFASLEASGTFGKSGPKGGLEVGLNAIIGHMQENATKDG